MRARNHVSRESLVSYLSPFGKDTGHERTISRRLTILGAMVAGLVLSGCNDGAPTAPPRLNGPSAEIKDGSHNNGAAHFFFASPITKDPTPTGKFNGAAQPTVSVCEWTGTVCSTVVAEFTVGKGTGGSTLKVEAGAERYAVNWNTGQCKTGACVLDPAKTYRIRVLVGGLEAGHADVDVVTSQAQAKNVNTNEYIPLVDGNTLQIRFRIEDGLSLTSSAVNTRTFYPNSRRYRDNGAHPATGRSGSAAIQARALLARDGSTLLEVTTGELDVSGAPPGNIDHVQLKLLTADNTVALTQNYTGLAAGGAWTHSYAGFGPRQAFQVQTNVSGIDASRTDVVTVRGAVQRRPDLAAISLNGPAQVAPNVPVPIIATIAERNLDVGATGNCVLYIEGVEADRVDGMWVAPAGSVSCEFMASFTGSGNKTATVTVESVVPGDDDLTNNSASVTVNVSQANDFYFGADAWEVDYRNFAQQYDFTATSSDNSLNYSDHQEYTYNGRYQGAYAYAWMTNAVAFPLAHLEISHASGGNALGGLSYDDLPADYTNAYSFDDSYWGHYSVSNSYVTRFAAVGNAYVQVYTVSAVWTGGTVPAGGWAYTQLSSSRNAAEASYFGRRAYSFVDTRRGYNNVGGYYYSYNDAIPGLATYGSDYLITSAVRGAGDDAPTYALRALIPSFYSYTYSGIPYCYGNSYYDPTFSRTITYQNCWTYSGAYTVTEGYSSGTPTSSP